MTRKRLPEKGRLPVLPEVEGRLVAAEACQMKGPRMSNSFPSTVLYRSFMEIDSLERQRPARVQMWLLKVAPERLHGMKHVHLQREESQPIIRRVETS